LVLFDTVISGQSNTIPLQKTKHGHSPFGGCSDEVRPLPCMMRHPVRIVPELFVYLFRDGTKVIFYQHASVGPQKPKPNNIFPVMLLNDSCFLATQAAWSNTAKSSADLAIISHRSQHKSDKFVALFRRRVLSKNHALQPKLGHTATQRLS